MHKYSVCLYSQTCVQRPLKWRLISILLDRKECRKLLLNRCFIITFELHISYYLSSGCTMLLHEWPINTDCTDEDQDTIQSMFLLCMVFLFFSVHTFKSTPLTVHCVIDNTAWVLDNLDRYRNDDFSCGSKMFAMEFYLSK